ncbi:unnamed protein product, partial [Urochloa humidicola]
VRPPIPSISSAPKPNIKNHHREVEIEERDTDSRFSHHLSLQFLYGACSPDPRRTKALPFSFFLLRLEGLFGFFPLLNFLVCNFCLDFQRYPILMHGRSYPVRWF